MELLYEKCGIWARDLLEEKNITLAFRLCLPAAIKGRLFLAAASCFRVYVDGDFRGFGPHRAAHGYARLSEYEIYGRTVVVEVHNPNVRSFCWVRQRPFFFAELKLEDGTCFGSEKFLCYRLTDRVQKVPRYSFQRGFTEVYLLNCDRTAFYIGKETSFPLLQTESVSLPCFLPRRTAEPLYGIHKPTAMIERGTVYSNSQRTVWRDRAHSIGERFDGFPIEEWEDSAIDEVARFCYHPNKGRGKLHYEILEFNCVIAGFFALNIQAERAGEVYLLFDEILTETDCSPRPTIDFKRNTCANVHKWNVSGAGKYQVETFEPYSLKYAVLVYSSGIHAELSVRDYENPCINRLQFKSNSMSLNRIVEAARRVLAHNSIDLFTDCPSRERAGWLCDSYFMGTAEKIFTGDNRTEQAFLENYAFWNREGLPTGMLPMCYPSDPYDTYLPNWAMWFVLEVCRFLRTSTDPVLGRKLREEVRGVIDYFCARENENGLLEDLDGWVFIEWSSANEKEHCAGVNIPTNICYASCLDAAAEILADRSFSVHAEQIRQFIRSYAFVDGFFVDNLIRDSENKLVPSNLYSEVCQYYALWFGCADGKRDQEFLAEILDKFGCEREDTFHPEIGRSNVFIGYYLRLDLLMREGRRDQLLKECLQIFSKMAERTGTLWEHNDVTASCDHGFASYVVKWILFALTGYDADSQTFEGVSGLLDCTWLLPLDEKEDLYIIVKNGKVYTERKAASFHGGRQ